jgi:hypothetical protein
MRTAKERVYRNGESVADAESRKDVEDDKEEGKREVRKERKKDQGWLVALLWQIPAAGRDSSFLLRE